MDIEEFVRKKLRENVPEEKIIEEGFKRVLEFKENEEFSLKFIKAVLEEVKASEKILKIKDETLKNLLLYPRAGVKMGEAGVGSRGEGDFFVHREIARIIKSCKSRAIIDSEDQDDAGVVKAKGKYIVAAVDGTHSRLSEFPFIAGFHVARAALRDIYVMGAEGLALLSDIHLADDGDVGKIFDFTAGIATVSEATEVPLIGGSTLRVGGDMVLGERLVSSVTAIGSGDHITARRHAKEGDLILMTVGSGGGTICATAIYHGYFDVVYETLNVNFILDCQKLIRNSLINKVHAMTDVTNGGIRGDAFEISKTAKVSLVFDYETLVKTVNKKVLKMLEELNIDFLGVSTGSLLIICPEDTAREIKRLIDVIEVGYVERGNKSYLLKDGRREELKPKFREAPYTPVKKVVDREPENFEEMKEKIRKACDEAIKKKEFVLNNLLKKRN
ncbi:AIR synthase related protein [Methanocaldococcus infernus ME]|uniref:AIR synthase related protein n=1 Tax=Methanocaldococcus infernus (strain DSM 11812 / JCM 15783 / ME) TaxID=573063 RepID=D5VSS6_METIM|nr:AIR synthase related protein [Methanocaldococcus infernus]ADG13629.1 AIR synthase related protein [Methanocaldococcus infernus ME]